jgi:ornithine--oxo-acid transaminase
MWRRLIKLDKMHGAQNYKPSPVILNRGKGVFLYDIEDKQYYDFVSSFSSVNQGHSHPQLVKIMKEQCGKLTLCSRAFYNENLCKFYEYMHQRFGYDKCLPMNTGVEAGDTAIKLARLWGYKTKKIEQNCAEVVVAKNNFWGRSIAACSSSTDPTCYTNFGPFVPGFHFVEYNNLDALENLFKINPNIVAYMVEPIQGEAGIKIPDNNYLLNVKYLCNKYNVLLICDEVQTGIGRTGEITASKYVNPDILVLGKALSGGMMPISCVLANNNIMDLIDPGTHGSTYGGNPLAAAIAPWAIEIVYTENLMKNARIQGSLFRDTLQQYVDSGHLKDVRGVGLLNAIEVEDNKKADRIVEKCMHNGLLTKVTKNGTIRMCPPLTISEFHMKKSLDIIEYVIKTVV